MYIHSNYDVVAKKQLVGVLIIPSERLTPLYPNTALHWYRNAPERRCGSLAMLLAVFVR